MIFKRLTIAAVIATATLSACLTGAYADQLEGQRWHKYSCDKATLHYMETKEFRGEGFTSYYEVYNMSATDCHPIDGAPLKGNMSDIAIEAKSLTVISKVGKQEKREDAWIRCRLGDGGDGNGLIVGEECHFLDDIGE